MSLLWRVQNLVHWESSGAPGRSGERGTKVISKRLSQIRVSFPQFCTWMKKNLLTCCRRSCLRGRSRRFAPKPLTVPDSFRGALPERRSWFLSRKQESERRGDSDSNQTRQNQATKLKMIKKKTLYTQYQKLEGSLEVFYSNRVYHSIPRPSIILEKWLCNLFLKISSVGALINCSNCQEIS